MTDEPFRLTPPPAVLPPSRWACVWCEHEPERHAVDDEEHRECLDCECDQYVCAT